MRASSSILVLAVACLTMAALAVAARAQTPQGTAFTYQGELRQNTMPVNSTADMVFRLYDASAVGNQIGPTLDFTADSGNAVSVMNGIFTVALDFGAPAFMSLISDERYLEIAVNGNVLTPRTKIENAPFALQSQTAELAYAVSNASVGAAQIVPTQVQKRVTGTCPAGSSIQSIAQDGSVTCQTAGGNGTITSISAGSGLTGGTITNSGTLAVDTAVIQQRVAGACAAGQYLQQINADGSVQCGVDAVGGTGTVTSVGAGLGLTGGPITNSGTLAVDPTLIQERVTGTCPTGSYMRGINVDGSVQCTALSQRTVFVTQVGTPQQNGAALLAAVASITASASDPWLVKIDVGVYDLGTSALTLTFVSLEGSGEALTTITSAGGLTVKAVSSVGIRELAIANSSATGVAIFARSLNFTSAQILVTRTSITATSIGIEAQGDSQGVYATTLLLRELTISAGGIGILDGSIGGGSAAANQLTATSIDITTPPASGKGLWVQLSGFTSKPHFYLTHSFVRGYYWRYGDSDTTDQFQAYFTDAFGASNGFPARCGAMAFGTTSVSDGSCP